MRAAAVELLTAAPASATTMGPGQHTRWPGLWRVLRAPLVLLRAAFGALRTAWQSCGYQPTACGHATATAQRPTATTWRFPQRAGKEQRQMDAQRSNSRNPEGSQQWADRNLCAYDRVTVSMWRDGHTAVASGQAGQGSAVPHCLAEAAAHAVLAVLRRCADLPELLTRYETSSAEEAALALIASLVPAACGAARTGAGDTPLRRIREASFYLRWLELCGRCST